MDIQPESCIFSKITLCTKESIGLLSDVWQHITGPEKKVICEHLGMINFVYFNSLSEEQQRKSGITPTEGGATGEWEGKCSVRIDLSRSDEIIKVSIAHELAHVLYNHPVEKVDSTTAEAEANEKAREWGYE